ncbi:hypothetical protein N9Y42_06175 [Mariniblastus sp.]|nr:hypothetical protein [Mariniblastus sp.]
MNAAEVINLTLTLHKAVAEYVAGETISGTAAWRALPEKTDLLSVRLIWYTQGKGDRDVDLVNSLDIEVVAELQSGEQNFEFVAPHRPCSFSGKLIELTWAVELIAYPSKDSVVETLVIGPDGKAIELSKSYEVKKSQFGRVISNGRREA